MSYRIFTDSSSNLTDDLIKQLGVSIIPLTFVIEDKEYLSYEEDKPTDLQRFYTMLREGKRITTSCVNTESFRDAFKQALDDGEDVLYIGFSSALSNTYQSGYTALKGLRFAYPDRQMYSVDTLGASLGEGLLVYYACMLKQQGKSITEVKDWLENNKLHLCHWFTVEDLKYLYRGGRVSKSAYFIANLIRIKPVMHMDNAGRLVGVSKAIGRKSSLLALADRVANNIVNPQEQVIFISHGDCQKDVDYLIDAVSKRVNVKGFVTNYVDPVVGAHCGPGTVAIFFLGGQR